MLRSYTLLNNKDNVIRRIRCHLIKMDSNFVKIENDNDIHNDRNQTRSKRQYVSSWTWRSGRTSRECHWTSKNIELHNLSRKNNNQTMSIWWIANSENVNCKRRMLCVTILCHYLVCVCVLHLSSVHVVILPPLHLSCVRKPKSIPFFSSIIAHLLHIICHSPSNSS